MKRFTIKCLATLLMMMVAGEVWGAEQPLSVIFSFGYAQWDGITASFSGTAQDEVTQTQSNVVCTYTRNGSSLYANTSALRFYKSNTLKFDAPDGYKITAISFTCTGFQSDFTSVPDACSSTSDNLSWINANGSTSVTFTRPSNATSYATITGATVTLESVENIGPTPKHKVFFSVNGSLLDDEGVDVEEGAAIVFPDEKPDDIQGKSFVGWTDECIDGTTDTQPTLFFEATMGTQNVTYYAVFANLELESSTVTWNISGVNTSASGGHDVNTTLKTSSISPTTETGVWTAVATSSYAGTSSSKAQLGSNSYKFVGTISLSGSAIPADAKITQIDLTATSSATDANPYTISATVGKTAFGTSQSLSTGSPNCQWKDRVVGNTIVLTTSCGYNKNIVISALSVVYESFSGSDYCTIVGTRKSLSSLSISGTPTQTTYYAGDAFDPAGLEVTGTYSNGTEETITEGIEWEIDYGTDNNALVAGTTSVDVMAYIGEVVSEVYTVTGLTVTEPVIITYEAKFFAEGIQVGETQTLKNGDDVVFPDDPTPSNEDYTFIGWSTSEILTPQDAKPSLVSSATMETEALNFYAVYAIKKRGESIEQNMNLSMGVNSGTEASSVNTWTLSDVLTITQKRGDTPSGKTQTNPNGNYLSSPRWYVYNLITFVPSREIEKVTVTSTTTGYASALQSSTYTNASASLKEEGGSVVYITPTDGNESFSVIMSGQSRISSISVTVAGGETYSGYTTTLPGNERETPTMTMDDISLAWGEELALAATTTPVDLEVTYSIKSGNENVAISAGVLKGIGVGSAVITATTTATAQYKSASIDVNVDVTVPVGIAAIRRQISSTLSGHPDPIMATILNAVVTYVSSSTTPTIYVEDETAGIAIYMKNTGLNPGDVITGTITGAGYVYNGLTEISQLELSSASITSGGEIPCTDVTIADLTANISGWASRRVRLSQVTVSAAIDNRNATVAQGDNSITVRESIGGCTSDLFGTEGASIAYIVGYPQAYNSTPQLNVWSVDDVFVAYNRSVTAGNWGTICLPRAVNLELSEDVKFYNIAGTSLKNGKIDGIVLVEEIEDLEAGKPYLFKATSSELKLYCFGVAVELPVPATGLVGNFSGNLPVPAGCYVLSSNKIRMVQEGAEAYAGPNRAYIDLDGVGEYDGSAANALRFGFDGEVEDYTTYIQTVQFDADVEIFNLLGNKVQTMKKGQLYIVNGKKMFNK